MIEVNDLVLMFDILDGGKASSMDWRAGRASLFRLLQELDASGHGGTPAAIHLADALIDFDHHLACEPLAA